MKQSKLIRIIADTQARIEDTLSDIWARPATDGIRQIHPGQGICVICQGIVETLIAIPDTDKNKFGISGTGACESCWRNAGDRKVDADRKGYCVGCGYGNNHGHDPRCPTRRVPPPIPDDEKANTMADDFESGAGKPADESPKRYWSEVELREILARVIGSRKRCPGCDYPIVEDLVRCLGCDPSSRRERRMLPAPENANA